MRHQQSSSPLDGLRLVKEFLSIQEEAALVRELTRLEFNPVYFIGATSRRELCHFGWEYAVTSRRLRPAPPIPDFMLALREKCAREGGLSAETLTQVITTHYLDT